MADLLEFPEDLTNPMALAIEMADRRIGFSPLSISSGAKCFGTFPLRKIVRLKRGLAS